MSWGSAYSGHMKGYRRTKDTHKKRYHICCASAVKRSHSKLRPFAKKNIWKATKH